MKIKRFFTITMFFLILFSFDALAFAITSYYWEEKPLILNPGESQTVRAFGLQNMVGNEDLTIQVEQISGLEIAEIIDNSLAYEVPHGSKDVYINMKVTIPEDAKIGEVHNIGATFRNLASGDGGNVALTSAIGNNIFVVVGEQIETELEEIPIKVEEPEIISKTVKEGFSNVGIIVIILIILVVALFYLRSKKKK